MNAELRHRDDIDGLRAVAVLPILLFHSGVSALAGGFVGVDIFFVISGFLITSIIARSLRRGDFTLAGFYRRRVVRIFPALFAMLAIVLGVGATILLPGEFERLAHSTVAALGFASNIYFWRISDYFAPSAELMPLLHTWSLGVEEQFYIFYPLALILVARWLRGRFALAIAAAGAASFAIGVVVAAGSPVAAFYLLPVRAWELLLGAIIAVTPLSQSFTLRWRTLLAGAGALLVLAAIVLIRAGPTFPIPSAILPTLGAAMLLAFGEGTFIGRALSWGPARYIGKISYSVYLWHWPVIAFYRIETGLELDALETVALTLASLVAGALSYHVVERPFMDRYRKRGRSGPIVAAGGTAIAAAIGAVALLATTAPAWRDIDPEVARIAAYDDYIDRPDYQYQFRRGPCFRGEAQAALAFDPGHCLALSNSRPNVVVLGDSYAAQYWRAVALRLPDSNVIQATASGCRPLLGTGGETRCREMVDYVLGPLLDTGRVSTVVLAGRWLPEDLPAIAPTVRHLQSGGARVIMIGATVEYQGNFPAILARSIARGDPALIDRWRAPGNAALDRKLESIVAPTGATYVSPLRILCPRACRWTTADGGPMQFDYGHLTLPGSRYVVERIPNLSNQGCLDDANHAVRPPNSASRTIRAMNGEVACGGA